jgi:MFS family permease
MTIGVRATATGGSTQPQDGSPQVSATRAWIGVAILWLFYVLSLMDRGVIALMVGPMMHDLGITALQMGVLQGFAFAMLYSLVALPLGWAVDHSRRRWLLFGGVIIWSVGTLYCGFAGSFAQMAVARALVGAGEAVLIPASLSLIADSFSRHRTATATAVFSSGAVVGSSAALIGGGALLQCIGSSCSSGFVSQLAPWRVVFRVFGVLGLLVAGLSFLVPDARLPATVRKAGPESAPWMELGAFLRRNGVVLACVFLAFPLLIAGTTAFLSWSPRHFESAFGWSAGKVGFVLGTMKLIAAPSGVILGGAIMDRALRAGVAAPYFVVPALTTLVGGPLLALGLLQAQPTAALTLLFFGTLVYNAFASSHYVILQVLAPPLLRGRLVAFYLLTITLVGTGLGALLPPLIGTMARSSGDDFGRATAIAIAGISLIAVVTLILGREKLQTALSATQHSQTLVVHP